MTSRKSNLPKKGSRIARVEAERFLELYNQLGSYKEVARITGRCADSVSRWVKILQAEQIIRLTN